MGEGLYLMMAEKQQEAGGGRAAILTGYVHSGSVDYLPDCCDKIPQSGSLHRKWEQFINPQDPPTTSLRLYLLEAPLPAQTAPLAQSIGVKRPCLWQTLHIQTTAVTCYLHPCSTSQGF